MVKRQSISLKAIFILMLFAVVHLCWLPSYGWARMVSTESLLESQIRQGIDRQFLLDALQRKEVRQELERYGVSRVEAAARINSLTDAEVAAINKKIKEMASGGNHYFGHDDNDEDELLLWLYIIGAIVALVIVVVGSLYLIKLASCPFSDASFNRCMQGKSGHEFEPDPESIDEDSIEDPTPVQPPSGDVPDVSSAPFESDTESVDVDSIEQIRPSPVPHEDTLCQSACYNEFSSCMNEVRRSGVADKYCDTTKSNCFKQCSR